MRSPLLDFILVLVAMSLIAVVSFLFLKVLLYGREVFSPIKESTPESTSVATIKEEAESLSPPLGLRPPPSFPTSGRTASPTKKEEVVSPSSRIPEGMVFIPAGRYIYGYKEDGSPLVVDLKAFYIDKYPVTNQEYQKFIKATGRKPPSDPRGPEYNIWKKGTFPLEIANHPVVNVTYEDALSYAKWAGKRLPTEMEWEKAAAGEEIRDYPWGKEFLPNYCNSAESGIDRTSPVDSFPLGISPYGCYDMVGNVWEWTSTLYDEKHNWHIAKGGSYKDSAPKIRDRANPIVQGPTVGFRCVKDLP